MISKQVPLFDVNEENYLSIGMVPFPDSFPNPELQNKKSYLTYHLDKFGNLIPSDRYTLHQIILEQIKELKAMLGNGPISYFGGGIFFNPDLKLPSANGVNLSGSRRPKQLVSFTFKPKEPFTMPVAEASLDDPLADEFFLEIDSLLPTYDTSFEDGSIVFNFDRNGNMLSPNGPKSPTLRGSPSTLGHTMAFANAGGAPKKTTLSLEEVKETIEKFCCVSPVLKALRGYFKSMFAKSEKNKKSDGVGDDGVNEGGSKKRTCRCWSFLGMFQGHCSAEVLPMSTSSSEFSFYVEAERAIEEAIADSKQT